MNKAAAIRGILLFSLILTSKKKIPYWQTLQKLRQLKMERSEHHLMSNLFLVLIATAVCIHGDNQTAPFHVGVLLDLDTLVGKMGWISILTAIDDFYDLHRNYTTRVVLHAKDTNNDVVQAAASGN